MAGLTTSTIRDVLNKTYHNQIRKSDFRRRFFGPESHITQFEALLPLNPTNDTISIDEFRKLYQFIYRTNITLGGRKRSGRTFRALTLLFQQSDQYKVNQDILKNDLQTKSLQIRTLGVLNQHGLFRDNHPIKEMHPLINDMIQRALTPMMPKFLLAIIDEDIETLRIMLDQYPQLLLIQPSPDLIIKSQLTHQQFFANRALTMAVQRRQRRLIYFLATYFSQLQKQGFINSENETMYLQATEFSKEDVEQDDDKYSPFDLMEDLIETFSTETFDNDRLNEKTMKLLCELDKKLYPEQPIHLSTYFNPEQLLIIAYDYYEKCHDRFNDEININLGILRRDVFCLRVIGRIQCALTREMAEIYCEGIKKFADQSNTVISEHAHNLLSVNKKGYYPKEYTWKTEVYNGLGREFFIDTNGFAVSGDGFQIMSGRLYHQDKYLLLHDILQTIDRSMQNFIDELKKPSMTPEPYRP